MALSLKYYRINNEISECNPFFLTVFFPNIFFRFFNSNFNFSLFFLHSGILKGKVKKDVETGYIKSTTITHWKQVVYKGCIERMVADNDISGGEIHISEKQNPTAHDEG